MSRTKKQNDIQTILGKDNMENRGLRRLRLQDLIVFWEGSVTKTDLTMIIPNFFHSF